MDWKKLFKPTVGKLAFIVIVFFLFELLSPVTDAHYDVGLPLNYRRGGCTQPPKPGTEAYFGSQCANDFYPINLVIDIAFWYLLAALGSLITKDRK